MSWESVIAAGGTTVTAIGQYADSRIATLTKVCLSSLSHIDAIREAQASIGELQRLKNLHASLAMDQLRKGN